MFNFENMEFTSYDFLLNVCDWISCTNENISFEEFLFHLENNGVKFQIKRSYEYQYVVIDKDTYYKFFALLTNNNNIRITRIDIKFDTFQDFFEMYLPRIEDIKPSSCIGKKDRFETIYFGSRNSDIYCRFYDKTKESNLKFPCSRLEFEIKGYIAKNFSLRYSLIDSDDALNYLLDNIQDFMYHHNITGLISFPSYGEYCKVDIISRCTKIEKFRRFCKQYSNSILDYLDSFNLSGNEFINLLEEDTYNEFLNEESCI